MNTKMEAPYRYLSGDAIRRRVETVVEVFSAMKERLDRERRAMGRIWKERDKQRERVIGATAGIYAEPRGAIGHSIPDIAALALDDELPQLGGLK